jgi:hypothetical protein
VSSELLVTSSGEVGIAIALKSFLGIGSETDSDIARFLEASNEIESCFSMGSHGSEEYLAIWWVAYMMSGQVVWAKYCIQRGISTTGA